LRFFAQRIRDSLPFFHYRCACESHQSLRPVFLACGTLHFAFPAQTAFKGRFARPFTRLSVLLLRYHCHLSANPGPQFHGESRPP
jgi:hypothetical protein